MIIGGSARSGSIAGEPKTEGSWTEKSPTGTGLSPCTLTTRMVRGSPEISRRRFSGTNADVYGFQSETSQRAASSKGRAAAVSPAVRTLKESRKCESTGAIWCAPPSPISGGVIRSRRRTGSEP